MKIVSFLLSVGLLSNFGSLGAEAEEYTKKRIQYSIDCTTTMWNKHYSKSCNLTNIIITNLDNHTLQLNNLTFVTEILPLKWDKDLRLTCFTKHHYLIGQNYSFPAQLFYPNVIHNSGGGLDWDEFVDNITCFELSINEHRTSSFEKWGTKDISGGCILETKGYSSSCSLYRIRYDNEYDVTMVATKNGRLEIYEAVHTIHKNVSSALPCIPVENFPYTKYKVVPDKYQPDICDVIALRLTPIRCYDEEWNDYAWKYCSVVALGSDVAFGSDMVQFDTIYDDVISKDLTTFCRSKLPKLNSCMGDKRFCDSPSMVRYEYYTKLHRSINAICDNQKNFAAGNKCMNEILSDSNMNATYHSRAENCTSESMLDNCTKYSRDILCNAAAQFLTHKTCASFPVVYEYQRLVADRADAELNCRAIELDPCILGIKDRDICSGSQLQYSICALLFVILNYITKTGSYIPS